MSRAQLAWKRGFTLIGFALCFAASSVALALTPAAAEDFVTSLVKCEGSNQYRAPVDLVLIADNSASMSVNVGTFGAQATDPQDSAMGYVRKLSERLFKRLDSNDKVGIVPFSGVIYDETSTMIPRIIPVSDIDIVLPTIPQLDLDKNAFGGNIYAAINHSRRLLKPTAPSRDRVIVVASDSAINSSDIPWSASASGSYDFSHLPELPIVNNARHIQFYQYQSIDLSLKAKAEERTEFYVVNLGRLEYNPYVKALASKPQYGYYVNDEISLQATVSSIINFLCERDDDADGINNFRECFENGICYDTDGDGKLDYLDTDSDTDGKSDTEECPLGKECPVSDTDGIPDYLDPDDNLQEPGDNSTGDKNRNGIRDGDECGDSVPCQDSDKDKIPDYFDDDCDNDGLSDFYECFERGICYDTDGDDKLDYLDTDSDDDGKSDTEECPLGKNCPDSDTDGIPDYLDPDDNLQEPGDNSTGDKNRNGISDGVECGFADLCVDTDGDKVPDYFDRDNDTVVPTIIPTEQPTEQPTARPTVVPTIIPTVKPTEQPTAIPTPIPTVKPTAIPTVKPTAQPTVEPISSVDEREDTDSKVEPTHTIESGPDPIETAHEEEGDKDDDGIPDNVECFVNDKCQDFDGDGKPNDEDDDSDNDNVSDEVECPNAGQCPDTDRDGLPDFVDNDTNTENPQGDRQGDSDNDGISDANECPNWVYCPDDNKNNIPDFMEKEEVTDELIDLRPLLTQVLRNVNLDTLAVKKCLGQYLERIIAGFHAS